MTDRNDSPLLHHKHYAAPSAFRPENLLREARRQKGLAEATVPRVCVLDPDGDIVRQLKVDGRGVIDPAWACYHTEMVRWDRAPEPIGFVGCAVGAPFAVLVAEQLFASGCRLLISMTSAGQLVERRPPPYVLLIERALRDEGTSHHYAAPAAFSVLDPKLAARLVNAFRGIDVKVEPGTSWTTDAPYRETEAAIAAMRDLGLDAVEMEAAALYAFATARAAAVVCFANITNQMGRIDGDFEKGESNGTVDALAVVAATALALS